MIKLDQANVTDTLLARIGKIFRGFYASLGFILAEFLFLKIVGFYTFRKSSPDEHPALPRRYGRLSARISQVSPELGKPSLLVDDLQRTALPVHLDPVTRIP